MSAFIVHALPMILCLFIGTLLLVIEAFMPGFGIAGIAGAILELAAVVLMFLQSGPVAALILLLLILLVLTVLVCFSLHSFRKGKLSKSSLVLHEEEHIGGTANTPVLAGMTGNTVTPLRPMGIAEFDTVRVNVFSEGTFIPEGSSVRVISTDGGKIVVRKHEDS